MQATRRLDRIAALAVLLLPATIFVESPTADGAVQPQETRNITAPAQRLRIGCDACGDLRQLSILHLVTGRDGNVIVLDQYPPFVRVFDVQTGALARSFGDKGHGPGQISVPGRIYLDANSSVLVHESMPPAFKRFDQQGNWKETIVQPRLVPVMTAFDTGRSLLYLLAFSMRNPLPRISVLDVTTAEETVFLAAEALPGLGDRAPEHGPMHTIAVAPDGRVAVANIYTYEVAVFDSAGERLLAFQRGTAAADGTGALQIDAYGLKYDLDGRLWVLTTRGGDGRTVFDVFGRDGRYVESVVLQAEIYDRIPAFDFADGALVTVGVTASGNTVVDVWALNSAGSVATEVKAATQEPHEPV
jgi:hypothetical protein